MGVRQNHPNYMIFGSIPKIKITDHLFSKNNWFWPTVTKVFDVKMSQHDIRYRSEEISPAVSSKLAPKPGVFKVPSSALKHFSLALRFPVHLPLAKMQLNDAAKGLLHHDDIATSLMAIGQLPLGVQEAQAVQLFSLQFHYFDAQEHAISWENAFQVRGCS